MLVMALPVSSRNAPTISLLIKQKPVSSIALMVPENARVNNETLTITVLFTKFSLKVGRLGCDTVSPGTGDRLRRADQVDKACSVLAVTGVIGVADKALRSEGQRNVGRPSSWPIAWV